MAEAPEQQAATGSTSALIRGFNELPPARKIGLMVAVALVIAIVIGSWIWLQAPDYRTLYSNLSERDGGAVIDSLQKLNVPYKMSDNGTITVPSNMVYETRLKLASQGLPKGGAAGFDLMDNMKLGATQFQENVTYQRALEGEITRTIEAISSVQGARVHLAIPKETVFVREQQKPSASILVNLYPGRSLDKAQVEGIVYLVASSVPDMPPANVTIVDQNSNLLTANKKENTLGLDSSQLEYLHAVEQTYIRRITDILEPITGPNNLRAQVTADLDFAQTEQTAETYKPNPTPEQSSVRSRQTSETQSDTGANASGVPGAMSNQPPGAASAPINAPNRPAGSAAGANGANAAPQTTGGSTHKESTTNYELDKTISHVRNPVGSIKRLSVAVVVNNRSEKDKKGKSVTRPLTKDEMTQIYNLAREAMGFNQTRGDTLNVVNASFNISEEEVASPPLWKDPSMVSLAKDLVKYLIVAGLLMYLLMGIIRPTLRDLQQAGEAEERAEREAEFGERGGLEDAAEGVGDVVNIGGKRAHTYEDDLHMVKELSKDDPKLVANVLKDWVTKV
ncbi:flagellar M-ring protein FliF [Novimethylophilus kurashikiensis]|uniref:Flagellar M-ring protein n=1 Tax=Novimethylophilus kurashikiensis TaxID=1825523 RepID=A0A2R5F799_9PROT|nr:flagellar basal-body MS-ring/collar protein FliF [Novimethylophilus kurashikiensis]GBG12561.1 flagellar M-ring protein FliF [Novimethylophilus kurashikiensis]